MTNYDLEVINGIIQGSLYFVIEFKATASSKSTLGEVYKTITNKFCVSIRSSRPTVLKTAFLLSLQDFLQIETK